MRLASLLTALLAVGCSHDLAPLSTREPEPAFLGELAGVYFGLMAIDDDELQVLQALTWLDEAARRDSGVPLAAGAPSLDDIVPLLRYAPTREVVYLQHLVANSQADAIVSAILPPDALEEDAETEAVAVNGPLLAGGLSKDGDLVLHVDDTAPPVLGRRLAGGAGFFLDDFYRVCRGGRRHRFDAARQCEFNPALSGMYETVVSACDGSNPHDTYLGLGFVENTVVGVQYPELSSLLLGSFDRFAEGGFNIVFSTPSGRAAYATFDLSEQDGELVYTQDVIDPTTDTCTERHVGTRLSGGANISCTVVGGGELGPFVFLEYSGAQRRDLEVYVRNDSRALLGAYDFGTVTALRAVGESEPTYPDPLPPFEPGTPVPYAARYSNLPNGSYELFVVDLDGSDSTAATRALSPRLAPPLCVTIPGPP